MRLEIDKKRFKDMLVQFRGDAPYQVELVKELLNQMPPQVKENVIEELYFENLYKGEVYIAQHCVFQEDRHFFVSLQSLRDFLKGRSFDINPALLDTLDDKTLRLYERKNQPICGYDIRKGNI